MYNSADRISELPLEILASILSLLPLKEAVATSLLSRHWRHVWAYTLTLDFDPEKTLFGFTYLSRMLQDKKSRRYVNWVNRVVEQHNGPNIKSFRACFDLDRRFTSSIDKWIEFALKKRVQVFVLDFVKIYGINKDAYAFPQKLLGLKKEFASNHYVGFKSLKVLYFENVDVIGEILEYFLSHYPVLERLSVSLAKSLVNLRVVGPSVELKYLVLNYCFILKSVEICNTKLVSFIHTGFAIDLRLSNVPSLVEVAISGRDIDRLCASTDFMRLAFTQLSCCLYQLETFMINITLMEYNKDHVFPILSNIKHFELTVDRDYEWGLSKLSSFMKAFPYLQRLTLKLRVWGSEEKRKIQKAAKCPHHYLKVVEVLDYCGRRNIVEHVMFLIENAFALEKLVIDPMTWECHHSGSEWGKTERLKEAKARHHAMHFKNKVPATVEFVCL
ncbi:hypothetical protein ACE6H2_005954 [Prunus campanulata]